MQRRTFLQATATSALTAALARPLLAIPNSHPYMSKIGLQVWTVRNQMAQSIPNTVKAIADAGYYQAELGSVLDADPIIAACKDNGLAVTSSFINWEAIANPTRRGVPSIDSIIEKAADLNLKHLVFGYIGKGQRETADHYKRHADNANAAAAKAKEAGIKMCYHNHSFEFAQLPTGEYGWDIFVDRFDNELMPFEVDVFWVKIGGRDPIDAINKLKGRITQIHLKDLKAGTATETDEGRVANDAFQELGNGNIDMLTVMSAASAAGAEQCHVEQDQSPDPIASINTSINYLRNA